MGGSSLSTCKNARLNTHHYTRTQKPGVAQAKLNIVVPEEVCTHGPGIKKGLAYDEYQHRPYIGRIYGAACDRHSSVKVADM